MLDEIRKIFQDIASPSYVAKINKTAEGVDGRIVSYVDRDSYISEQYRVLRTNLYSLSPEKPIRTIAITSSQSGEGKTVTSCNLAATLSLDVKRKILLVDGDLRKPDVHKMFNIPRKPGFSDIVMGNVNIEDFLKKPAVGNLYIIPSGTIVSNPAELLSYAKIKELVNELKNVFDYIIFDTPPTLNVTDSSIIGSLCDGVVLVVKSDITLRSLVEETYDLLRKAQAKVIGCILANFHMPMHYYYKYKYYYKYAYKEKKT